MLGKDLIMQTLLGGGSGGSGGGGGGIPQADIDAAFAALAEKGVTVPDGATSAELDDLIASIVTGGADISPMLYFASGFVTPAENVTSIVLDGYKEAWLNYGYMVIAIGIASVNGLTLESKAVRVAIAQRGGWDSRAMTASSASSYYPSIASMDYVDFSSSGVLPAGITYRYVIAAHN